MGRVDPTPHERETMGFDCWENEGLVGAEHFQRCTQVLSSSWPKFIIIWRHGSGASARLRYNDFMNEKISDNFRSMVQESIEGYQSRLILMRKKRASPSEIAYVEKCIANFVAILKKEDAEQLGVAK